MRNTIYIIAVFILIIFQVGVLGPLHLTETNLPLVFVVVAAIISDFDSGLIITVTAGLFLTLLSDSTVGIVMLDFLLTFLGLYLVVNYLIAKEPNQIILFSSSASATVCYFVLYIVLASVWNFFHLSNLVVDLKYIFGQQLPENLILNFIFTYPIFRYFILIEKLFPKLKNA
jgi:hypothetical protein